MAVAIISGLVGAVIGAVLARLLTPNYSRQLAELRQQVGDFQKEALG